MDIMDTIEVKSTAKNGRKYFTIDITKFKKGTDYYIVIYKFKNQQLQNTQYVWKPQIVETILSNLSTKDDFISYFELLKYSDIMSESLIMEGTRLSAVENDPFITDGDYLDIETEFHNLTRYIGDKKSFGYVGELDTYYQFDVYSMNIEDLGSSKGIKFKERRIIKGVLRNIITDDVSDKVIPNFINGEEISNNKLKYLLTDRIDQINKIM